MLTQHIISNTNTGCGAAMQGLQMGCYSNQESHVTDIHTMNTYVIMWLLYNTSIYMYMVATCINI